MKKVQLLSALLLCLYFSAFGQPKREFRASWIATLVNLDWPSEPGLPVEDQQAELIHILDQLKAKGMNALILQVRPAGSVFFASSFEPWSEYLTGVQGRNPGYDPLAFALQEAHARGMELHAWVNPFRVDFKYDQGKPLGRNHLIRTHPEWIVQYGPNLYLDPGIPEAREYVVDLIEEMIRQYKVDALHLDDYFYPYPIGGRPFPDSLSYELFGRGPINSWRRDNINQFMQGLRDRMLRVDATIKLGVSPFGVWRNRSDDPRGSATRAGIRSYDDLHADILYWIEQGWLDYVAPQLYFSIGYGPADFRILLEWWAREARNTQLYIGHAAYKVGANADPNWQRPQELLNQVQTLRANRQANGSIFFRSKFVLANPLNSTDMLQAKAYARPALVPKLDYLQLQTPEAPGRLLSKARIPGPILNWVPSADSSTYHVVYRVEGKAPVDTSAHNMYQILGHQSYWVDSLAKPFKRYSYRITTVSRQHAESTPTQVITQRNWWGWIRRKK